MTDYRKLPVKVFFITLLTWTAENLNIQLWLFRKLRIHKDGKPAKNRMSQINKFADMFM